MYCQTDTTLLLVVHISQNSLIVFILYVAPLLTYTQFPYLIATNYACAHNTVE